MNLLFRLWWLLRFGARRGQVPALGPCTTPMRVWPNDLDLLRHMNNGRYGSVMDLARIDLMLRSGLWPKLKQLGWYPVVVNQSIAYRRSLQVWQTYAVRTHVVAWDERHILMEQVFERKRHGETEVVATGWVKARFLKQSGGSVPTADLLKLAGVAPDQASPQLLEWLLAWDKAHEDWAARAGQPAA